jgi:hypothetical protein
MTLAEQVEALQLKADAYDNVMERIGSLCDFIADWDSKNPDRLPLNHENKIKPVRDLVELYSHETIAFKAKVKEEGYSQLLLNKYCDSRYKNEKIEFIRVYLDNGNIAIGTSSCVHFPEGEYSKNIYGSGDSVLCEISGIEYLEIIK